MNIVIVIPTYNEVDNIETLVKGIFKYNKGVSILFVDDNSPDGTAEKIRNMQTKYTNINLITGEKKGLGEAYKRGFLYVKEKMKADYIIQMDADLSHNPKDIQRLINETPQYDIVIGSRYINGGSIPKDWGIYRKLNSKIGNTLTKFILKIPYKDCTAGFKIINTKCLPINFIKNIRSNGYLFQVEILYYFYKKGYKVKEIPIHFSDRVNGKSKMGIQEAFDYMKHLKTVKRKYK
jgi:dolichol-phosphate mannosyltransferase